jgi:hypothetical protein
VEVLVLHIPVYYSVFGLFYGNIIVLSRE